MEHESHTSTMDAPGDGTVKDNDDEQRTGLNHVIPIGGLPLVVDNLLRW
jgi:hypothetical protein